MSQFVIAGVIFVLLAAAALVTMNVQVKLRSHHLSEETNAVVRLVANIFVVMTSLVFGLMINSAKTTFESIDHNTHAYATDLIVLNRTLRNYGPKADAARHQLTRYVEDAIRNPTRADDRLKQRPDLAGETLDGVGREISAIQPDDSYQASLLVDVRQQYHRIVEQRWAIIEQSEGNIPVPMIAMLTAWLVLIFASFGYRAPRNRVTVGTFVVSALLIAASIYLTLDMTDPFAGPIQISDMPYRRALAEMNSGR
ncbi:MAG TPA: hypothetical protein VF796_25980 [Humisphaera sp.]